MLRKLMKHELRATSRVMLPLFLLVLVTAVGANMSTRTLLGTDNNLLNVLGMILLTAFVIAIAAAFIMAFVLMVQRFYKNLLQDEGYVMMTLPVTVHEHVWSKLLVSLIWYVASFVVVAAAIFILIFDIEFVNQFLAGFDGLWEFINELSASEQFIHMIFALIEFVLLMIVSLAANCLQFYAAMAIGQSFANRKILMSVLVYFGFDFAFQIIGGLIGAIADSSGIASSMVSYLSSMDGAAAIHPVMIVSLLFVAVLGFIFYFITTYFLTNRLNLE